MNKPKKEPVKKLYTGQDNYGRELAKQAWASFVADRNRAIDRQRAKQQAKR